MWWSGHPGLGSPKMLTKTAEKIKIVFLKPIYYANDTVICQIYGSKITAGIFLVPTLWEYIYFPNGCRRRNLFFLLQIVNTVIETSSCDHRRSISTETQPTANPLGIWQGQRI